MQWWYGHNAVAFFLTTPYLGLMYYYLPKAADRPVFSYRLSIVHFWSLVFVYIWAGPHHLHLTALPEWASTLGMLFSLILWMPSWGGMVNGLFTLRGAWHKLREDPILKFMVVAVTYYGMSTFEGPMMSIKSVNAVSHYTDWTIGHVHAGALGWNAFLLVRHPLLGRAEALEDAAVLDEARDGALLDRDRRPHRLPGVDVGGRHSRSGGCGAPSSPMADSPTRTSSRRSSGSCRCTGSGSWRPSCSSRACLLAVCNILKTIRSAPADYAVEPEIPVPPLVKDRRAPGAVTPANTYDHALFRWQHEFRHGIHRALESRIVLFTILVTARPVRRLARPGDPDVLRRVERQGDREREALHAARGRSGATSTSARAATTAIRR